MFDAHKDQMSRIMVSLLNVNMSLYSSLFDYKLNLGTLQIISFTIC